MALFSKPPAKKPAPAAPESPIGKVRPRAPSAREAVQSSGRGRAEPPKVEPAPQDGATDASLIEWSPSQPAIEVAQANPGLCGALENAALLFASDQSKAARALLEQAVVSDPEARQSPLAWLALFDLLQRAGDRAAFDQLSLQYVVEFERSPPAWEERAPKTAAPGPKVSAGGFLAITGALTASSASQVDALRRAIARQVAQARLDLASISGFDDAGARLLADALAEARRRRFALALQRPEKLRALVEAAVDRGVESGEGAWLLSLELMQWMHDPSKFDERAIDYAVAFEMSPPSWEPPPERGADAEPAAEPVDAASASDPEAVALSGVVTGSATEALARITAHAQTHRVVPIDLTAVERIDFVCVRALLLLIGISPRHFVRKAA